MRKTVLTLTVACLGMQAPLHAANEYTDVVPVELAQVLLGNGRDIHFYDGLPEDFPVRQLPDGVEVLGSMENNNQQRVMLRSGRSFASVSIAVSRQLISDGWQAIPSPIPRMPGGAGGFVSTGGGAASLCHDELGSININPVGNQNSGLMQIYYSQMSGVAANNFCQQRIESMRNNAYANDLHQYMPILSLPDDLLVQGAVLNQQGSSGGGGSYETRATLSAALPVADVLSAFRPQLLEQGWAVDAEGAGAVTANSSWTREVEVQGGETLSIIGLLRVIEQEEYSFSMNFQIISRGTVSAQSVYMRAQPQIRGFAR